MVRRHDHSGSIGKSVGPGEHTAALTVLLLMSIDSYLWKCYFSPTHIAHAISCGSDFGAFQVFLDPFHVFRRLPLTIGGYQKNALFTDLNAS